MCVHVKTLKKYNDLLVYLDSVGFTWSGGEGIFDRKHWDNYKVNTCICINENGNYLHFSPYNFYEKKGYDMVEFKNISKKGKVDEDKLNRMFILNKLGRGL